MELLSCAFKIHFSIVKTAGHMYKKGTKKKNTKMCQRIPKLIDSIVPIK